MSTGHRCITTVCGRRCLQPHDRPPVALPPRCAEHRRRVGHRPRQRADGAGAHRLPAPDEHRHGRPSPGRSGLPPTCAPRPSTHVSDCTAGGGGSMAGGRLGRRPRAGSIRCSCNGPPTCSRTRSGISSTSSSATRRTSATGWGARYPSSTPITTTSDSSAGCTPFGLEESGHYGAAEEEGLAAMAANRDDVWGVHGRAHLRDAGPDRRRSAVHARPRSRLGRGRPVHRAQLVAPRALLPGSRDRARALAIYDGQVHHAGSAGVPIEMLDASALLWRLLLDGADTAIASARSPTHGRGGRRLSRGTRSTTCTPSWPTSAPVARARAQAIVDRRRRGRDRDRHERVDGQGDRPSRSGCRDRVRRGQVCRRDRLVECRSGVACTSEGVRTHSATPSAHRAGGRVEGRRAPSRPCALRRADRRSASPSNYNSHPRPRPACLGAAGTGAPAKGAGRTEPPPFRSIDEPLSSFQPMARYCERPGCSQPAEAIYGMSSALLSVCGSSPRRSAGGTSGRALSAPHADAMVPCSPRAGPSTTAANPHHVCSVRPSRRTTSGRRRNRGAHASATAATTPGNWSSCAPAEVVEAAEAAVPRGPSPEPEPVAQSEPVAEPEPVAAPADATNPDGARSRHGDPCSTRATTSTGS